MYFTFIAPLGHVPQTTNGRIESLGRTVSIGALFADNGAGIPDEVNTIHMLIKKKLVN